MGDPSEMRAPVVSDWRDCQYPMDMAAGSAPNFGDFRPPPIQAVGPCAPTKPVNPKDLDFVPGDGVPIFSKPRPEPAPSRRVPVRVGNRDYVPAAETAERDRMIQQAAREGAKKIMERFADEIRRFHAAKEWISNLSEAQREDPKLQADIERGYAIISKGLPMTEDRAYQLAYDKIAFQAEA